MLRTSLASALVAGWLAVSPGTTAAGRIELIGDNDTNGLVPGPAATDRNYTQGARITWADRADMAPSWAVRVADLIPGFGPVDHTGFVRTRYVGLAIGQEIYTPDAISKTEAIPDDQPYPGWLYGSGFVVVEDASRQRTLEVQAGTTGPLSLAANVQTWWHAKLAIRRPRGWNHQLHGEPGLIVRTEMRWRPFGSRRHVDMIPHLGASVGNVKTEARAGATLRLGLPLPDDFGPSRLMSTPGSQGIHLLHLLSGAPA